MNVARVYRPVSYLDFSAAVNMLPDGVVALVYTGSTRIAGCWHARCVSPKQLVTLSESIDSRLCSPVVFPDTAEMAKLLKSDEANPKCAGCRHVIG